MYPYLSVIIPTLNEEKFLPRLLSALAGQSRPPDEIIVADAGSVDGTVEVARKYSCRVVRGGLPARGRNEGAWAARGNVFLFLDADVLPDRTFLEKTLQEFERRRLDVATCYVAPLSERDIDSILHAFSNFYLRATQPIFPHAPGFCIFSRQEVHRAIGGFDGSLKLAEDHDYVQRASKVGRFGILSSAQIPVSVRRLDEDGRFNLSAKYFLVELRLMTGGKVQKELFDYRFGQHTASPVNGAGRGTLRLDWRERWRPFPPSWYEDFPPFYQHFQSHREEVIALIRRMQKRMTQWVGSNFTFSKEGERKRQVLSETIPDRRGQPGVDRDEMGAGG